MAEEKLIVGNHKWPESIDFDQDGNLYFTDAIEKALFQIKRSKDGALASTSIQLLYGLDHASGVSIDRENAFLYSSAKVKRPVRSSKSRLAGLKLVEMLIIFLFAGILWTTLLCDWKSSVWHRYRPKEEPTCKTIRW
jgi:hypothetical protein